MNYYLSMLDEKTIKVISGNCQAQIEISQVELCIIFSNLMKNAVEELGWQKEEKYINIDICVNEKGIKIEVVNSIYENKHNLQGSIKVNKRNHGIGLKNVKEVVEKNHGIFQCVVIEKNFKALVILPGQYLMD